MTFLRRAWSQPQKCQAFLLDSIKPSGARVERVGRFAELVRASLYLGVDYKQLIVLNCPQQSDGWRLLQSASADLHTVYHSCGVFVLMFAESLATGNRGPRSWSPEAVASRREEYARILSSGTTCYEREYIPTELFPLKQGSGPPLFCSYLQGI